MHGTWHPGLTLRHRLTLKKGKLGVTISDQQFGRFERKELLVILKSVCYNSPNVGNTVYTSQSVTLLDVSPECAKGTELFFTAPPDHKLNFLLNCLES